MPDWDSPSTRQVQINTTINHLVWFIKWALGTRHRSYLVVWSEGAVGDVWGEVGVVDSTEGEPIGPAAAEVGDINILHSEKNRNKWRWHQSTAWCCPWNGFNFDSQDTERTRRYWQMWVFVSQHRKIRTKSQRSCFKQPESHINAFRGSYNSITKWSEYNKHLNSMSHNDIKTVNNNSSI